MLRFTWLSMWLTIPKPRTGKGGQIYGKEDDFRTFTISVLLGTTRFLEPVLLCGAVQYVSAGWVIGMLKALRRAAANTPDKHLAAWYFPSNLSTECFCQRTIGVESVGITQRGSFGWWLNWELKMWVKTILINSFDRAENPEEMQKEKEKPDDQGGGY